MGLDGYVCCLGWSGSELSSKLEHATNVHLESTRSQESKGLSIYYVICDGGAGVFPIYYNIT